VTVEQINLLITLLSVFVAYVALVRARLIQTELLKLEKIHAKLSQKQLDELNTQESTRFKTQLNIALVNGNIFIRNIGFVKATNINITFVGSEAGFLVWGEEDKLPFPILNPNEEFKLLAGYEVTNGVIPVKITWINVDESIGDYHGVLSSKHITSH
jgi:hypothetical protein